MESEQAWILTSPISLACRRISLERLCALRSRLGGDPVVLEDLVGAERVERPVLEEGVDLPAHRRGAGHEHRRGVQLVVGP
jgi:hypothetical protein